MEVERERRFADQTQLFYQLVTGGRTDRWELLVPPGAELKFPRAADEARVAGVDAADRPFASLRTIRLKEPTSEPLAVKVTSADAMCSTKAATTSFP